MKSSEGILPPTEGVAAGATSLERDLEFFGPIFRDLPRLL
jgi:hypothetical protein